MDVEPVSTPVYDGYLADPFAWKVGDTYYMIGTGSPDAPVQNGRCFPGLVSSDFRNWEYATHILTVPDASLGNAYWAPEIAVADGRFYLYYSVGFEDKHHQLRVAVADQPLGPYTDTGAALTSLGITPFAIDPHPYQDTDGEWYLFYARDYLDTDGGARAGTALAVDRLLGMEGLAGMEQTVLRARHDWQRFASNRLMYGSRWDWHTLEGPFLWLRNGVYYCFYSGGRWDSDEYGIDYATAERAEGPYFDSSDYLHARITHTIPGGLIGPGHNSVLLGPDGRTYIVYHAWNVSRTVRSPYVSLLNWD